MALNMIALSYIEGMSNTIHLTFKEKKKNDSIALSPCAVVKSCDVGVSVAENQFDGSYRPYVAPFQGCSFRFVVPQHEG